MKPRFAGAFDLAGNYFSKLLGVIPVVEDFLTPKVMIDSSSSPLKPCLGL